VLVPLILVEVVGIMRGWGRLDHWAHLGGYAAGIVGATVLKQQAREQRRLEAERRKKTRGWSDQVLNGR
jgi:rhomboid-like protein